MQSSYLNGDSRQTANDPQCALHGTRIVHALPADCPMRAPDGSLKEIGRRQGRGWANLEMSDDAVMSGRRELDCADVCFNCVGSMSNNPVIRHLRRQVVARLEPTLADTGNGRQRARLGSMPLPGQLRGEAIP